MRKSASTRIRAGLRGTRRVIDMPVSVESFNPVVGVEPSICPSNGLLKRGTTGVMNRGWVMER